MLSDMLLLCPGVIGLEITQRTIASMEVISDLIVLNSLLAILAIHPAKIIGDRKKHGKKG